MRFRITRVYPQGTRVIENHLAPHRHIHIRHHGRKEMEAPA